MAILRTKLPKYLKELAAVYDTQGNFNLHELITQCRWNLRENTDHDNWNGGMDGHTVVLFSPIEALARVPIPRRKDTALAILGDLQDLNSVEDEYFVDLKLEAEDESDPEFQAATAFSGKPVIDPAAAGIWKPGLARVFISHRDKHKVAVQAIADALEDYGVCCFVAHETIPSDEDWVKVIKQGLETMEIMVAVTTEDFTSSIYCMQEVGWALGRGIPVISLKVSDADPAGFIANRQAARCPIDQPSKAAEILFPLLGKRLNLTNRFTDILVKSFCDAPDFSEAKNRFERLKRNTNQLSPVHIEQIIQAFASNSQLYNAGHLTSKYQRLVNYMNTVTDGDWAIEGNRGQ
ncbi:MAG: toll/interleukin-1 receptor domain-containing protein [Pseudomonadota bacterium]